MIPGIANVTVEWQEENEGKKTISTANIITTTNRPVTTINTTTTAIITSTSTTNKPIPTTIKHTLKTPIESTGSVISDNGTKSPSIKSSDSSQVSTSRPQTRISSAIQTTNPTEKLKHKTIAIQNMRTTNTPFIASPTKIETTARPNKRKKFRINGKQRVSNNQKKIPNNKKTNNAKVYMTARYYNTTKIILINNRVPPSNNAKPTKKHVLITRNQINY